MKTIVACGIVVLASSAYGMLALLMPLLNTSHTDRHARTTEF